MGSKLSKDFKVGQERCGGIIVEIHEETGNNYAVVECGACGKKTNSIYNRLKSNFSCSCQKAAGMVTAAKERKANEEKAFQVGDIISGRVITSIFVNKHGKTAAIMKCLSEACGKETSITLSELKRGHVCFCQAKSKADATLLANNKKNDP